MKIIAFTIICLFLHFSGLAKEDEAKTSPRNTVFSQFGGITYGSTGLKYQRILYEFNTEKLGLGAGFGIWYNLDLFGFLDSHYGRKVDVSLQYLKGHDGNYFDLEIGGILNMTSNASGVYKGKLNPKLLPNFRYSFNVLPNLHIGYRFQSEKGFLFRIGAGTPEIIKIAIGFSF